MKSTPENLVKRKLKKTIKDSHAFKNGELWFAALSDRYASGIPDVLMVHNGSAIFVECKAKDKNLTPIQNVIKKKIEAAGGKYIIYRGGNYLI